MADYSRQQDFSAKSGLPILGSDVDSEFDELVTVIAGKCDESREGAANGIATLDAAQLIPVANLPQATLTAIGAAEIATDLEVRTGADSDRIVSPSGLKALLDYNAGYLTDLIELSSPGSDRILFHDQSVGGLNFLQVSSDFSLSGTTLSLASTIAAQTITTLTSTTVNTTTLALAGGNVTAPAAQRLEIDGYVVATHQDTSFTSGKIWFNNSAPTTQGSNGDIWFEY